MTDRDDSHSLASLRSPRSRVWSQEKLLGFVAFIALASLSISGGGHALEAGSARSAALESQPDFKAFREDLLGAIAKKDDDAILDALERANAFDNAELAKIVVRYCVQHDDFLVHREALKVLGAMKSDEARQVIIDLARDAKQWEKRAHAVRVLSYYQGQTALSEVERALKDKKWQVRSAAYRGLANFRQRHTVELLIPALKKESGRLVADIQWSLEQLTGQGFGGYHQDWVNWWAGVKDSYILPSKADIKKMVNRDEKKDLGTAVREGLYGPIYSEKIAFLLDISGSMTVGTDTQGTRLEIAVRELGRVIQDQLTKDSFFNVFVFSEEVKPLHRKLVRADKRKTKKSAEILAKLTAGGETNAYAALKAAFDDPNVDTIYLLSDGTPTVGEQSIPQLILMEVEKWNRDRRVIINCIGFFPGDAKNQDKVEAREFLRSLAHAHEGFYKEVY